MDVVVLLCLVLLGWVAFGVLGAWIGGEKGRSRGEGAVLGFLFGPLGALIVVLLPSGSRGQTRDRDRADDAPDLPWLNDLAGTRKPSTPEEAWLKELENRHRPKP